MGRLLWRLCKRGHKLEPRNVRFNVYQGEVRRQCRECHRQGEVRRYRERKLKTPNYVLRTDWSMNREHR